jgi:predicted nucleic acid-binding protein
LSLVLDSSVTLAWVYSDEATAAVREVITKVVAGGAWVSSLWHLEVANVLEMGVRRGRHTAEFRDATLIDLALFPITTDAETEKQAWGATLQMASRNRLTVYDAAYLELAKRRDLPLATLDEDLRTAARAEGVGLLGV